MESVWEYRRGSKLPAGVWDTYVEILVTYADARNWLMADLDRIRSIGAMELPTVNVWEQINEKRVRNSVVQNSC